MPVSLNTIVSSSVAISLVCLMLFGTQTPAPPASGASSCGPTQMNRTMAGSETMLVSRKNRTQPTFSERTPPEDATTVRPSKASEESSAYCVAVKAGEHRLDM